MIGGSDTAVGSLGLGSSGSKRGGSGNISSSGRPGTVPKRPASPGAQLQHKADTSPYSLALMTGGNYSGLQTTSSTKQSKHISNSLTLLQEVEVKNLVQLKGRAG